MGVNEPHRGVGGGNAVLGTGLVVAGVPGGVVPHADHCATSGASFPRVFDVDAGSDSARSVLVSMTVLRLVLAVAQTVRGTQRGCCCDV